MAIDTAAGMGAGPPDPKRRPASQGGLNWQIEIPPPAMEGLADKPLYIVVHSRGIAMASKDLNTPKIVKKEELQLLTYKEVQQLVKISKMWLIRLAREGRFPAPVRISERIVRFRAAEIRAFVAGSWAPEVQK